MVHTGSEMLFGLVSVWVNFTLMIFLFIIVLQLMICKTITVCLRLVLTLSCCLEFGKVGKLPPLGRPTFQQ